jgi:hypothetical protein
MITFSNRAGAFPLRRDLSSRIQCWAVREVIAQRTFLGSKERRGGEGAIHSASEKSTRMSKPLAELQADSIHCGGLPCRRRRMPPGGGLRLEEIKAELISGRDLRKKGNRKRPPLLIKNHPDSDLQCTKLCA